MPPVAVTSIFEEAFQAFPQPVALLQADHVVMRANARLSAVLGMDPEKVQGESIHDLIQAEDPTWCSADPVDHLGTPRIGQTIKVKVNGKRRELVVAVYPLNDTDCRLVTVTDAEEGQRDRSAERDYKTSLEELCACVAHEIRNPLTGIRTTVQFVMSKLDEKDPHRGDLREILSEMDRIEQIIGDLLRFGRPAEIAKEKSDLNTLITRILDSIDAQMKGDDIEIRRNLSGDIPEFPFSSDSLQQVLLNLVRNAAEAMPEGGRLGVSTSLRTFRSEKPDQIEIVVTDTGHGIPPDLLSDVFKPFFTTRHNGTGLGLPISLGIVRAHGGTITVRNRSRGGSVFRVLLPIPGEGK